MSIKLKLDQVQFPATQVPSTDVNCLDDYEEGTWTPALTFGAGSTGLTYVSRSGFYTKIGRLVHYVGRIDLSAKGSSTGAAELTGLPFTVGLANVPAASPWFLNLASITGQVTPLTVGSLVALYQITAGSVVALSDANFTNTSVVLVSGTYIV